MQASEYGNLSRSYKIANILTERFTDEPLENNLNQ